MAPSVLAGFAGVLVAAAATGLLAGECIRHPWTGFIVWAAVALAPTAALGAQIIGFTSGFGPLTFRVTQPPPDAHFQIIAHYTLILVQAVAVAAGLAGFAMTTVRGIDTAAPAPGPRALGPGGMSERRLISR